MRYVDLELDVDALVSSYSKSTASLYHILVMLVLLSLEEW